MPPKDRYSYDNILATSGRPEPRCRARITSEASLNRSSSSTRYPQFDPQHAAYQLVVKPIIRVACRALHCRADRPCSVSKECQQSLKRKSTVEINVLTGVFGHLELTPSFLNPVPLRVFNEKPQNRTTGAAEVRMECLGSGENRSCSIRKPSAEANLPGLGQTHSSGQIVTPTLRTCAAGPTLALTRSSGISSFTIHASAFLHPVGQCSVYSVCDSAT